MAFLAVFVALKIAHRAGVYAGWAWFPTGVFGPNGGHEQHANGEKTPKPGSFGVWGPPTTKVVATPLNQEPAKCAIAQSAEQAEPCG